MRADGSDNRRPVLWVQFVAAAFDPDQLAAGQIGDSHAALERHDLVVCAVDDAKRTGDRSAAAFRPTRP